MMFSVMFSVDIADILTIDSWDSMDQKKWLLPRTHRTFHMFSNKQWGYNQVSWGHSKGCMGYVTSLTQHDSWICLETDMGQIGISQKKHPRTMIRSGNLTVCY